MKKIKLEESETFSFDRKLFPEFFSFSKENFFAKAFYHVTEIF